MKNSLSVKFYRSLAGPVETYGKPFNLQLDTLVGGPDKWDMNNSHGRATLPRTHAVLERHEDGPELINLLISEVPAYLTAIASLITAWVGVRKVKQELRKVSIQIGANKFEGVIKDPSEAKKIITMLKTMR